MSSASLKSSIKFQSNMTAANFLITFKLPFKLSLSHSSFTEDYVANYKDDIVRLRGRFVKLIKDASKCEFQIGTFFSPCCFRYAHTSKTLSSALELWQWIKL